MNKMKEKRLKINLELHVVGDGRTFLNFWDYICGDDVICEFKDGKLYRNDTEITLQKFIDEVRQKF
jgi:hypothetical protein